MCIRDSRAVARDRPRHHSRVADLTPAQLRFQGQFRTCADAEPVSYTHLEGDPAEIRLSSGAVTRLWQNDVNVDGEHTQVLATYEGEEADEWELDGTRCV